MTGTKSVTIGVLALQGAFREHLQLLQLAAKHLPPSPYIFHFTLVRTAAELSACSALIIPGGESTTMALIASSNNLLQPLREFVKVDRKPAWGTCAGMILLAEKANRTKQGGQDLIGGLDIKVERNAFGRQRESFVTDLEMPWLDGKGTEVAPFKAVFIRAPVVETVLPVAELETSVVAAPVKAVKSVLGVAGEEESEVAAPSLKPKSRLEEKVMDGRWEVEVLTELPPQKEGDEKRIVAVRQGNVVGTSFHPELTGDWRMHRWWLMTVVEDLMRREKVEEDLKTV